MTIVLIPLANGAIGLADYRRNRTSSSRSLRLREKSYPSNDEEQYFPSTRNAPESTGERWSGPVMRGEKRLSIVKSFWTNLGKAQRIQRKGRGAMAATGHKPVVHTVGWRGRI